MSDSSSPEATLQSSPGTQPVHTTEFDTIHTLERRELGLREPIDTLAGCGLAFSGGGIRSASFALGVLQLLLNKDLLKRFDYLSTVSGGGYLGSALSWWLHWSSTSIAAPLPGAGPAGDGPLPQVSAEAAARADNDARYQAFRKQFGSRVHGARTWARSGGSRTGTIHSNWLAYVRQHGNYLQPPGIGFLSLAASVLRVSTYTLLVYCSALVSLFCVIRLWHPPIDVDPQVIVGGVIGGFGALLFSLLTVLYGPLTWVTSTPITKTWWPQDSSDLYRWRSLFRDLSGTLLGIVLVGSLIGSVPLVAGLVGHLSPKLWPFATSTTGLGFLGSLYQFRQGRAGLTQPALLTRLRIILTAALVLYGLLLLAYAATNEAASMGVEATAMAAVASAVVAAFLGFCVNTNYAGIARLYRDRLMETFLPDLNSVEKNGWGLATHADQLAMTALQGRLQPDGQLCRTVGGARCQRPLHLVNCNVVLIDSPKDIYRNRSGDSFFISPLWSGSDATGWVPTTRLGDGAVSLATAMSISGAAANPNAAPNGRGVTRNRLVSFLMSLFNVRLGYWMPNLTAGGSANSAGRANRPNLWVPGFYQGLMGRGLSEDAAFLELTDGGHFDNTGVYELVRRRTRLILVAEGGQDGKYSMDDLANVIEKVRVDFSVFIEFVDPQFSFDGLRAPLEGSLPKRGFALGRIRYPRGNETDETFDEGWLVYLQAIPVATMPTEVDSFRRQNTQFPNDPTADQFFDEQHVEAYRELGYSIARDLFGELENSYDRTKSITQVADLLLDRTRRS